MPVGVHPMVAEGLDVDVIADERQVEEGIGQEIVRRRPEDREGISDDIVIPAEGRGLLGRGLFSGDEPGIIPVIDFRIAGQGGLQGLAGVGRVGLGGRGRDQRHGRAVPSPDRDFGAAAPRELQPDAVVRGQPDVHRVEPQAQPAGTVAESLEPDDDLRPGPGRDAGVAELDDQEFAVLGPAQVQVELQAFQRLGSQGPREEAQALERLDGQPAARPARARRSRGASSRSPEFRPSFRARKA